jgi:hypothetical protein
MTRATAAPGHFPYAHRTLAEIEADALVNRRAEIARIAHAYHKPAPPAAISAPRWCDQCEQRRWPMQASQCASQFCSLRAAA